MRIAIAGVGGAASRGHLPALAQLEKRMTVVGAADPDAGRRTELAMRLPRLPVFASTEEMLARVGCDVLVVATEPGSHAALVALGMQHGLHVVCEKPLSVTRAEYDAIAQACARRPDLALIPVHQYRYSPQWTSISRWARAAARLRRPYSLTIDLQRVGTNPYATSRWRTDLRGTGGMLADQGVHFLALAWTIDKQLDPLAAVRQPDESGHERAAAIVRMGHGVLTIQASNAAAVRHTTVELGLDRATITWFDDAATITVGKRTLLRRRVDALTDQSHVNALYLSLYRDLVENLSHDTWRKHRTAEALGVGSTLLTLLERTPIDAVLGG
jgi:predicted dehydrogenase